MESALLAHVSPPDITYEHHLEVTVKLLPAVVANSTLITCQLHDSLTMLWAPLQVWACCLYTGKFPAYCCPERLAHSR